MQRMAIISVAATLVTAAGARAEYRGPGAAPSEVTVKMILDKPKDEQAVVLQGTIVRQEKDERYFFSDGTGEIRIEVDKKKFPPQPIDQSTKVQITGEVEKDFLRAPTIDVRSLAVVQE